MKQGKLFENLAVGSKEKTKARTQFEPRTTHGGLESRGKRKLPRPFFAKTSMHIVLKSKRAKGTWSLKHRKNQSKITSMVYVYAARFRVHVYRFANVGDHLHLHVKASLRKDLADFLRVLAGRIAVTVSGARKYVKRIGKFWDHLYWSRMVNAGRDFHFVDRYIFANELEGVGIDLDDEKFRKRIRAEVLKNPYLIPKPT
jgi:REP element-mobilizing transposase RayT